ncbi:MAG: DUF2284 domain-containing protein [Eubacterium sp.]
MEFIHKFSIGPVEMDKMLEEYHQLRKTRRYCAVCPNYQKYWSCPEYGFDEVIFLKEFKYMYLIAREYEIPREDRQKVIGIQAVSEYCKQAMQTLKVQSWKDLLELENEVPGTLSLMPGNCHICDISGEGCTRPSGQKCRHPELMRFSLESLGFDVDAICKYEIGLLLLWPKEGHLPEKLSGVMALMSNEKIPMDVIKSHFPDAKKSWLRFSDGALESRNEVHQSVKRQESWIDNQAKAKREMTSDPNYRTSQSWVGFKSNVLDSGDYIKECPWRQDEIEEDKEASKIVEDKVEMASVGEIKTTEESIDAVNELSTQETEEEKKYQWLGFKRSVEEAEEDLKKRPIPKFNLPEEEESAEETVTEERSEVTQEAESNSVAEIIPETEIQSEPEPEPIKEEPIPEPEPIEEEIELPNASSVANVLSAAIEIAKDVVGDDFIRDDRPIFETSESPKEETTGSDDEDDSKYKWLGFKASNLEEEDDLSKPKWKKNE